MRNDSDRLKAYERGERIYRAGGSVADDDIDGHAAQCGWLDAMADRVRANCAAISTVTKPKKPHAKPDMRTAKDVTDDDRATIDTRSLSDPPEGDAE